MASLLVVVAAGCGDQTPAGRPITSTSALTAATVTTTTATAATAATTEASTNASVTTATISAAAAGSTDCTPVDVLPDEPADVEHQAENVTKTIVTHPYDIFGATIAELRSQLNRCHPTEAASKSDAYTRWYLSWHFWVSTSDRCAISRVAVNVRVDTYLPQWANPVPDPDVALPWARYLDALKTHEDGHRQRAFDAARDAHAAITKVPPSDDCDDLRERATQAGQHVLDAARQQDIAYDLATDHGLNQGASLG